MYKSYSHLLAIFIAISLLTSTVAAKSFLSASNPLRNFDGSVAVVGSLLTCLEG